MYDFIIHIKIEKFYDNIKNNVEERFHTSNYEVQIPFTKGNLKVQKNYKT